MSFQDLEAGTLPPAPLPQVVAHGVFQLNTKVETLRQLGAALGTPKDSPALRGRLRRTRAEAARLARTTSQKLKQAAAGGGGGGSKLVMDFEAAMREFQQVQQRIAAAERQETAAAAAAGRRHHTPFGHPPIFASTSLSDSHRNDGAAGTSADHDQQQQQVLAARTQELVCLDSEIAFNETVIEEREQGIREVQQEIFDIHDIFRDLAALVCDQGEAVDHVVSSLDGTAAATSQAEEELSRAAGVGTPVSSTKSQLEEEQLSGAASETPVPSSSSSTNCLLVVALGLLLLIFVVVLVD